MANINASAEEQIYTVKRWLGVNECADGDTKLKQGEASVCRNWRVTRDGNLQIRAGYKSLCNLVKDSNRSKQVKFLWHGRVQNEEVTLAVCNGYLWKIEFTETDEVEAVEIKDIGDTETAFIFGYSMNAYIMTGADYLVYDGEECKTVVGYRPLVSVSVPPEGGGEALESVNKLNGMRRSQFSPDGTGKTFQLPEAEIESVDYVKSAITGEALDGWTADTAKGTVTFTSAPSKGVNSIEIGWTFPTDYAEQIKAMRYAEIYNGSTDNRVFVYGDGSNQTFYSGLDDLGLATAEYFPDLNVIAVGEANTPITSLIRHYSRLIAYKTDSAWSIQYGTKTLADESTIAAFYTLPINRSIGNEAVGQVQLVLNSPYTLANSTIYDWRNNASYSSNLTVDERQAKIVSERVSATLSQLDLSKAYCYDHNEEQEWYCIEGGTAIIHNYAVDAWYTYSEFNFTALASVDSFLYGGTADGKLALINRRYRDDDGVAIPAQWASGSMAFEKDFRRKYSAMLWVGIKPESGAKVEVSVQTDRKADFSKQIVSRAIATFSPANFARWSFKTGRRPQMTRLKIKAKKFTYYKLLLTLEDAAATCTVVSADIRVRSTGYVK